MTFYDFMTSGTPVQCHGLNEGVQHHSRVEFTDFTDKLLRDYERLWPNLLKYGTPKSN